MLRFKPILEDISFGEKVILRQQKDTFPNVLRPLLGMGYQLHSMGSGGSAQLTMPAVAAFPKGNSIGNAGGSSHGCLWRVRTC